MLKNEIFTASGLLLKTNSNTISLLVEKFYFYTTDEDTTVIVHVWSVNNRERITLCCQLYSDITTFNTLVNLIDEGTCTVNTIR